MIYTRSVYNRQVMIRSLKTASEVIDALGGTAEVARLTDSSLQSVSNWRASGRLARSTFMVMGEALAEIECEAPPRLWGMKSASKRRGAAR